MNLDTFKDAKTIMHNFLGPKHFDTLCHRYNNVGCILKDSEILRMFASAELYPFFEQEVIKILHYDIWYDYFRYNKTYKEWVRNWQKLLRIMKMNQW